MKLETKEIDIGGLKLIRFAKKVWSKYTGLSIVLIITTTCIWPATLVAKASAAVQSGEVCFVFPFIFIWIMLSVTVVLLVGLIETLCERIKSVIKVFSDMWKDI